jgi:hypothetical protein
VTTPYLGVYADGPFEVEVEYHYPDRRIDSRIRVRFRPQGVEGGWISLSCDPNQVVELARDILAGVHRLTEGQDRLTSHIEDGFAEDGNPE